MCVGYFLVLLDVTVVNVALPDIGARARRRCRPACSGWSTATPSRSPACCSSAARWVTSTATDEWSSPDWRCSASRRSRAVSRPDVGWLVGARFAQGVGAALLLPGTLAIITDAFPDRAAAGPRHRRLGRRRQRRAARRAAARRTAGRVARLACGVLPQRADRAGRGRRHDAPVVPVRRPHGDRRVDWPGAAARRPRCSRPSRSRSSRAAVAAGRRPPCCSAVFVLVERAAAGPDAAAAPVPQAGVLGGQRGGRRDEPVHARTAVPGHAVPADRAAPTRRSAPGSRCCRCSCRSRCSPRSPGRLAARVGARRPDGRRAPRGGRGFALLTVLRTDSSYWTLLPALLLWGGGLGVLTPAVVAAAVAAAVAERSGLASGGQQHRPAGGWRGRHRGVRGRRGDCVERPGCSSRESTVLASSRSVLFLVAALSTVLMRSN